MAVARVLKIGSFIPGSTCLFFAKVSIGKTLNPKLTPMEEEHEFVCVYMCECKWLTPYTPEKESREKEWNEVTDEKNVSNLFSVAAWSHIALCFCVSLSFMITRAVSLRPVERPRWFLRFLVCGESHYSQDHFLRPKSCLCAHQTATVMFTPNLPKRNWVNGAFSAPNFTADRWAVTHTTVVLSPGLSVLFDSQNMLFKR